MKKKLTLFTAAWLCFSFNSYADELIWYVAASMIVPAKKTVALYNRQHKDHRVLLVTGGSGQLLSKIQLSKKGDIYSPASRHYIKKCLDTGLVRQHKLFLLQEPVFGLSSKGSQKITTFSDLLTPGVRISVGNPQTMALGRLFLQIEERLPGETVAAIRKNTALKALNVTQIANYLKKNIIDAGTIFNTVALAHNIPYVEIPHSANVLSESFWIELTISKNHASIARFKEHVDNNIIVFEEYGFKLPSRIQVIK